VSPSPSGRKIRNVARCSNDESKRKVSLARSLVRSFARLPARAIPVFYARAYACITSSKVVTLCLNRSVSRPYEVTS
jgi:hypothetical protein